MNNEEEKLIKTFIEEILKQEEINKLISQLILKNKNSSEYQNLISYLKLAINHKIAVISNWLN